MDELHKMDAKQLFALEVDTMVEAVEILEQAVTAQVAGDFSRVQQHAQEVVKREKKVDRIKDAIVEKMFGGGRLPFSKGDRFEVIDNVDKITDQAEIVARQLVFMEIPIPKGIQAEYAKMLAKTTATAHAIREAIVTLDSDLMEAKNKCKNVEDERREVRDLQWTLLPRLLQVEDLSHFQVLNLKDIIEGIGKLADIAEDFSDFIVALAVKYITLR